MREHEAEGHGEGHSHAHAHQAVPSDVALRVVARAWVDPVYKARLLSDATAAIAELGYGKPVTLVCGEP